MNRPLLLALGAVVVAGVLVSTVAIRDGSHAKVQREYARASSKAPFANGSFGAVGTAVTMIRVKKGQRVVYGTGADDTIYARDGVRELIICGPGYDRVYADWNDRADRSCERVFRAPRP